VIFCFCRRGAQEVAGLIANLCAAVDATRAAITDHMAREEADVLPLLRRRLCAKQQRDLVWRTLRAMPLRLLERVLPWLAGTPPPCSQHLCWHQRASLLTARVKVFNGGCYFAW
jgi:hypothetical protein